MSGGRPTRIVLADDHPIVLDGLERLFRLEPDFEVVGRCRGGGELLALLRTEPADLVILDLRMPDLDGIAVLETIGRENLPVAVLLLTAAIDSGQLVAALAGGARGLMLKETAPETVVEAARAIAAGGTWFDAAQLARAEEERARRAAVSAGGPRSLTPREREIALLVAEGSRNEAIASRLAISEGTVKLHLHHVYEKLGLAGRLELVLYAQKHGL